jgi:hypothetical protein
VCLQRQFGCCCAFLIHWILHNAMGQFWWSSHRPKAALSREREARLSLSLSHVGARFLLTCRVLRRYQRMRGDRSRGLIRADKHLLCGWTCVHLLTQAASLHRPNPIPPRTRAADANRDVVTRRHFSGSACRLPQESDTHRPATATPIKARPGFVLSPYSHAVFDVRKCAHREMVEDVWLGKIFLVP